jgi:4a-hydroxytetrahydrobiopterin dehydratase
MGDLADRSCVPCRRGTPPLRGEALRALAAQVPAWRVVDEHHLERRIDLPDFASALQLVNAIGAIAEAEHHHPDLELAWGRVVARIWTHTIGGLCEADFVLAAKIDRCAAARPQG